MGINAEIQKLIVELKQARTAVAKAEREVRSLEREVRSLEDKLRSYQTQIDEGIAALPEPPKTRKKRKDAGIKRGEEPDGKMRAEADSDQEGNESTQQEAQDGQGKPRKRKAKENTIEGEMTPEKAAASRLKVHILCPGCKEGATCVKVDQEASDCWEAKDLIRRTE